MKYSCNNFTNSNINYNMNLINIYIKSVKLHYRGTFKTLYMEKPYYHEYYFIQATRNVIYWQVNLK